MKYNKTIFTIKWELVMVYPADHLSLHVYGVPCPQIVFYKLIISFHISQSANPHDDWYMPKNSTPYKNRLNRFVQIDYFFPYKSISQSMMIGTCQK